MRAEVLKVFRPIPEFTQKTGIGLISQSVSLQPECSERNLFPRCIDRVQGVGCFYRHQLGIAVSLLPFQDVLTKFPGAHGKRHFRFGQDAFGSLLPFLVAESPRVTSASNHLNSSYDQDLLQSTSHSLDFSIRRVCGLSLPSSLSLYNWQRILTVSPIICPRCGIRTGMCSSFQTQARFLSRNSKRLARSSRIQVSKHSIAPRTCVLSY